MEPALALLSPRGDGIQSSAKIFEMKNLSDNGLGLPAEAIVSQRLPLGISRIRGIQCNGASHRIFESPGTSSVCRCRNIRRGWIRRTRVGYLGATVLLAA